MKAVVSPENDRGIRDWLRQAKEDAEEICKRRGLPQSESVLMLRELVEAKAKASMKQVADDEMHLDQDQKQELEEVFLSYFRKVLEDVLAER